jgi:hypothetical protein
MEKLMAGIKWTAGHPPEKQQGNRLLLIGSPIDGTHDAADDNRLDIFIGHFGFAQDAYVPARARGMSEKEARPRLDVKYWSEIDAPADVQLRTLTIRAFNG